MLESTELPRYAEALRKATFRPVFGALTLSGGAQCMQMLVF